MRTVLCSSRGGWCVCGRGGVCPGDGCPGGVCRGVSAQGVAVRGCRGYLPGGCLPGGGEGGCLPSGGVCPTPPSPCEQNDTGVKTLPYRNYVADGNKSVQFYISQFLLVYVSVSVSSSVNTSLRSIDRMITSFNVRKLARRTNIGDYYKGLLRAISLHLIGLRKEDERSKEQYI